MTLGISKPAEAAYVIASIKLLPVGLIGLIVIAILTATMNTMDTELNTNIAILIKDIYPKLLRRFKWTPIDFDKEIGSSNDLSQLKVIGRFGTAIAGFIAMMLIIPNPIGGR